MTPAEYEQMISQIVMKLTNSTPLIERGKVDYGTRNKWNGASGFCHQIDVSIAGETEVLLVECKQWGEQNDVPAEAFLTLFGRVIDIGERLQREGKTVRGALVVSNRAQSGMYKLTNYYRERMSLFKASSIDDLVVEIHHHLLRPPHIQSATKLYAPTVSPTSVKE